MNGKNEILHKYLHSSFTNMAAMVSTVKGANDDRQCLVICSWKPACVFVEPGEKLKSATDKTATSDLK